MTARRGLADALRGLGELKGSLKESPAAPGLLDEKLHSTDEALGQKFSGFAKELELAKANADEQSASGALFSGLFTVFSGHLSGSARRRSRSWRSSGGGAGLTAVPCVGSEMRTRLQPPSARSGGSRR